MLSFRILPFRIVFWKKSSFLKRFEKLRDVIYVSSVCSNFIFKEIHCYLKQLHKGITSIHLPENWRYRISNLHLHQSKYKPWVTLLAIDFCNDTTVTVDRSFSFFTLCPTFSHCSVLSHFARRTYLALWWLTLDIYIWYYI